MNSGISSRFLNLIYPIRVAEAHCDIPCGIYDPHEAQIAALTVIRMNQLINDLPKHSSEASPAEVEAYHSKLNRYVKVKEDHAEKCKSELRILWGDYFKPEHLQQHGNLHELFWNAMKLASKTRQEVNLSVAETLLNEVQKIAEIFWKTKGAEVRKQPSLQASGGELVYPIAK
jgi:nickel superoxide dismutase